MADRLNDPHAATAYKVNEQERDFKPRDIRRLVDTLFPKTLDAQHTIAHLERLKRTPGYETLEYYPEFVPSASGDSSSTLKSIGIVMPDACVLMRDYGGVLYADATFGIVLLLLKALLVVVVDGEGHNHLVSCFLTPGEDEAEWLKIFDSIAKIDGVKHMQKCVLMRDEDQAIKNAFDHSAIPKMMTTATCKLYTKWKMAAQKMRNNATFGAPAARKYCDNVRHASCGAHYRYAVSQLATEYLQAGDSPRCEHVQGHLAATDIPLCQQEEVFMGLHNNPSEQTNFVYKKTASGRKLTLLGWTCKTLQMNRKQSSQPKVAVKKLRRLQDAIEAAQSGTQPLDGARYTIMRVCLQTLTYWVCRKIQFDLWSMDNHTYFSDNEDGSHVVRHRREEAWYFTVTLRNDKWMCVSPEGRRCWRNCRLGRPCQHILLVWAELLRRTPNELDLCTITRSFNRVYRRTAYADMHDNPYKQAPPPPTPTTLTVNSVTHNALAQTRTQLQFMLAVTEDKSCVSLQCLQALINRYAYVGGVGC